MYRLLSIIYATLLAPSPQVLADDGLTCPQIDNLEASVLDGVCVWKHIRYGTIDLEDQTYGWYSRSKVNMVTEQFTDSEKEESLHEEDESHNKIKRVRCLQSEVAKVVGQADCLALNVFSPIAGDSSGDGLPVMIWIHGGMFTVGAADDWVYRDAQAFASNENIVIVSINYRLNYFGFLSFDENTLNNGLHDQRNAIEWVHKNIKAFGGNPEKLTVAGESAGATSAMLQALYDEDLVASDDARKRLVTGVIIQSNPSGIFLHSGADKLDDFNRASSSTGCGGALFKPNEAKRKEFFECMKKLGGDVVLSGQKVLTSSFFGKQGGLIDGFYFLGPASGTDFVKSQPVESLGKLSIPNIQGTNREEGLYFALILEEALQGVAGVASWSALSAAMYGSKASTQKHYDAAEEGQLFAGWTATMTDYLFYCPMANNLPFSQNTYVYQSKMSDVCSGPYAGPGFCDSVSSVCIGKACHGNEVPSLFGSWGSKSSCCESSDKYEKLTRALQSEWGQFVRTGSPNSSWEPYTAKEKVMIFNAEGSVGLGASEYNALYLLDSVCADFHRAYGGGAEKDTKVEL